MLIFLPDYLQELPEDSPIVCLKATFYAGDPLSHRDFLGALMGYGIDRSCVGDICVGSGVCHFFVSEEIAPHLLRDFDKAGRTALHLSAIDLSQFTPPEEKTEILSDTVPSLRLDCILSSGFRISRSLADTYIRAGKAAIDGLPCEKPDRAVAEGATLSVRGLGKIRLLEVGNRSKKDRIFIKIEKFM
jgi:RNA-binding protein YlmH